MMDINVNIATYMANELEYSMLMNGYLSYRVDIIEYITLHWKPARKLDSSS